MDTRGVRIVSALLLLLALLSLHGSASAAEIPTYRDVSTIAAAFQKPAGIAIDPDTGNVYVADTKNHCVRRIAPDGVVSLVAGSGVPGLADGSGRAAQFHEPSGIAWDRAHKRLLVADRHNHVIRQVTAEGGVSTIAGTGRRGFADSATALAGAFDQPTGIAVAVDGSVYVADTANSAIRRLSPAGQLSTVAGGARAGNEDGTLRLATFAQPEGVALRADGAIVVADTGNDRLRLIADGVVRTISGNRGGFLDGVAASALFLKPRGVAFDEGGNLYVADTGNGAIRVLAASFATVTTLAGAPDRRNVPQPIDGPLSIAAFSEPSALVFAGGIFVVDARHDAVRLIAPELRLTTVHPARGPATGGNTLRLLGSGFMPGAISVAVGSSAATNIQYVNSNEVQATAPAGRGTVVVTFTNRDASAGLADAYTYLAPPTIASVAPVRGPASGGQLVTIEGTEFVSGGTTVSFGGATASVVTVESATRLTAIAPRQASGTVAVTVATDAGSTTRSAAYTYVPAPVIVSFEPVAAQVGATITIRGTNFADFAADNQVVFGNVPAVITFASPVELRCVVPTGARTAPISVATIGGTSITAAPFIVVDFKSLAVVPVASNVQVGATLALHAIATRTDGSQADASAEAQWQSSNENVAKVVGSTVSAVAAGSATITASYVGLTASATVTVQPSEPVPPDPAAVSPPLDPTVYQSVFNATSFLYSGSNPIQTDVFAGAIVPERAAVMRGHVLNREGNPLPGVTIAIHEHSEVGRTLSRRDGAYDIVVNGGGPLVVEFSKSGYLTAHRRVTAAWQSYEHVDDVVLVPLDAGATHVAMNASVAQIARAGVVTDEDGARRATIFVPAGTAASMVLPDGSTRELTEMTVRATEFTVSDRGPAAMPATLPPTSGYTYCVELSADEAIGSGATKIMFNSPVAFYVENFLNFPVGGVVPSGYYDRAQSRWVAAPNGRVIRLLAGTDGLAAIDINGDGAADDAATLAAIGITAEERTVLRGLYAPNATLWRVPIAHFTPWDFNWPHGLPHDAVGPKNKKPWMKDPKSNDPLICAGSIIECENQTLGESVELRGSPFTLNYRSDRVNGRKEPRTLVIPVSGSTIPASLSAIAVSVSVAGQAWSTSVPAAPNGSVEFTWNGLDAYGRSVNGAALAHVQVTYVYPAVYNDPRPVPNTFGLPSGAAMVPLIPLRVDQVLSQEFGVFIDGVHTNAADALGGWSISPHHSYDPATQTLYLGTGERRSAHDLAPVIKRFAGQANIWGNTGDGGSALDATLLNPSYVMAAADGSVYISDGGSRTIRRVTSGGTITTIAGNPASRDYDHDGEPALNAGLTSLSDVVMGTGGTLYINNGSRIQRLSGNTITTIAGPAPCCGTGDGGPARLAGFFAKAIAVDRDENIYLADNSAIRVINAASGIITSLTAPGCRGPVLNGPAATSCVNATSLAIGPDGLLYGQWGGAVWRISSAGNVDVVAGCYNCSTVAVDGASSKSGRVAARDAWGLAIGADGTIYLNDDSTTKTYRRVTTDGIINTFAGDGTRGIAGDDGPARAAQFVNPWGVSVGPDGAIYVADQPAGVVRKIEGALPKFNTSQYMVAAEHGDELYVFNAAGRHLRTIGLKSGETRYEFAYTTRGELAAITDRDGRATMIQRDSSGNPVAVITAEGLITALKVDSEGYLSEVSVANRLYRMTYAAGGLLTAFTAPDGSTGVFTYGKSGALFQDTTPGAGTRTLQRAVAGTTTTSSITFPSGGKISIVRTEQADDAIRRVVTRAGGDKSETLARPSGTIDVTSADGVIVSAVQGGDPRFGMAAPILRAFSYKQPSGLTFSGSHVRQTALADPKNPFSLTTQTDTFISNGQLSSVTYLANARTMTRRSPLGREISLSFDGQGRLSHATVPTNTEANFGYWDGFLSSMQVGSRAWSLTYDQLHRLSTFSAPAGRRLFFYYNAAGLLDHQTLPGARTVSYAYDTGGNVTAVETPAGSTHRFSYVAGSRRATYVAPAIDGVAFTTTYRYREDGRLSQIARPDGIVEQVGYDGDGRVTAITSDASQLTFGYIANGRVASVTAPRSNLVFSYDGSLLKSATAAGAVQGSVSWVYDASFRVVSESVNGSAVAFQYDSDGLLTTAGALTIERNPFSGAVQRSVIGNVIETWSYNEYGEVVGHNVEYQGSPVVTFSYTRDAGGRIATADVNGNVKQFAYDSAGRLERVSLGTTATAEYGYDANNNRTLRRGLGSTDRGTYDAQDRIVTYADSTYTYTPNGDLESITTGGVRTTFTYDAFRRLSGVESPGLTIEYVSDGLGRRIRKQVNGSVTRAWLYTDKVRIAAELDGSANVVSRFVYGARRNVPDYMLRDGQTYRIVSDHLGSPRLVINVATGDIAQRIDYDEFGTIISDTNRGFQPFGFAGGLVDTDTGLVRFGARDYDPRTGRWTSKDPIGFAGGDPNLYAYGLGDPVNHIDPSGKWIGVDEIGGAVIGGVINSAAYAVGQAIKYHGNLKCISGADLAVSFGVGFVAGFFATDTFGASLAVGSVANAAQYVGIQAVHGRNITTEGVGANAVAGAIGGLASYMAKGAEASTIENLARGPERFNYPASAIDSAIDAFPRNMLGAYVANADPDCGCN
ncbi:MAG: IPT/TIG domain-containing protein [Acidobacteriota bacterium]|nr:IPT/TIG domain-containing protein [Acidobacteriota bacterium]